MGKGGALEGRMAQEQTAMDRRVLRQEYRRLFANVVEGKEQLEDAGSGVLVGMLDNLEALRDKVEKPREHAVDADVLCHLTECGLTMVNRGHAAHQGRTPAAFITMLRSKYAPDTTSTSRAAAAPEAMQWAALGGGAAAYHAPAPGAACMLGLLGVQPKARAAATVGQRRRRRGAEPAGAVVTPQELATEEIRGEHDKQETDRNMLVMWECLQRAGGASSFAALVLNHGSFSQTVENIFTLSFLVRDRRVSLQMDAERGLLVRSAPKGAPVAAGAAAQAMLSVDTAFWEAMRAATPPGVCLMPHRAPGSHGGSAAAAVPAGGRGVQRHGAGKRRRDGNSEDNGGVAGGEDGSTGDGE